ncbi:MAG: ECF-type sigma factor [Pseudomonadota bacterium]
MDVEVTQLLNAAKLGDEHAREAMLEALYPQLRTLAQQQLNRVGRGGLQTTEIVHEAYLKLFDPGVTSAQDRAHFYALCSRAMRQVLIDHFREGATEKRGGGQRPITFDEDTVPTQGRGEVLLELDEALQRLAAQRPRLARIVEMRFFGGMTQVEVAEVLGLTERTVRVEWVKAKAWLADDMGVSGQG